jgi:hypothetical protein
LQREELNERTLSEMDTSELKYRLGRILAEEEGDGPVDWVAVQRLSDELHGELQMPIPLIVDEYLRGCERRRLDELFGRAQRSELLFFLRNRAEPAR